MTKKLVTKYTPFALYSLKNSSPFAAKKYTLCVFFYYKWKLQKSFTLFCFVAKTNQKSKKKNLYLVLYLREKNQKKTFVTFV